MGPHGIPLDEYTLDAMSVVERDFWMKFQERAKLEIKESDRGNGKLIAPSLELQAEYEIAVTQYAGRKYCQVAQLEQIFSFRRDDHTEAAAANH